MRLRLSKKYLSILGKKKDKVKVVLKLEYAKCFWITENNQPGICFFHSGKEYKFSSTEEIVSKWKRELRKSVIVTDFHERYSPIAKIGSGSFSKVYLVNHILTGRKYAAKQFSKKKNLKTT